MAPPNFAFLLSLTGNKMKVGFFCYMYALTPNIVIIDGSCTMFFCLNYVADVGCVLNIVKARKTLRAANTNLYKKKLNYVVRGSLVF
jgi:hypothetical protein